MSVASREIGREIAVEKESDGAIEVGPVDGNAGVGETLQNFGTRVAECVASANGDNCISGADSSEEFRSR